MHESNSGAQLARFAPVAETPPPGGVSFSDVSPAQQAANDAFRTRNKGDRDGG
jgi:hypothetical protein